MVALSVVLQAKCCSQQVEAEADAGDFAGEAAGVGSEESGGGSRDSQGQAGGKGL